MGMDSDLSPQPVDGLTVDQCISKFLDLWENPDKVGLAPDVWPKFTSFASLRAKGVEILREYHDRAQNNPRELIATEHRFLVPFGRHELTGVVDKLDIRLSGKGTNLLRLVDTAGQPPDTLILTPQGWKPLEQLAVGDLLLTADGLQAAIAGVHRVGVADQVQVEFSDGSSVRCATGQVWEVTDLYGIRRRLRVDEFKPLTKGRNHRYFVDTVEPAEFSASATLIHPYVMGVWLGDGSACAEGVRFTKPEPELIAQVAALVPAGTRLIEHAKGTCSIVSTAGGRNPMLDALRELGLSRLRSYERFIPPEYLRSTVADRRQVLAGLLDTDGSSSNRTQFRTTSNDLCRDIRELCRSLGGVPHARLHPSWYTDRDGDRHEARPAWHVTPGVSFNPFLLSRKAVGWKPPVHRQNRWITAVVPLPASPMVVVELAPDTKAYVTENWVPMTSACAASSVSTGRAA
jgi:ATP-dependent DNA helicase RecG